MEEILYIIKLGFSGADVIRGLWIGLLGSLLVNSKLRTSRVSILAFILDRIWPYVMMSFQGHTQSAIWAAVTGAIISAPLDLPYYIIRFCGLYILIYVGYNLRCKLHGVDPMHRRKPGSRAHFMPF